MDNTELIQKAAKQINAHNIGDRLFGNVGCALVTKDDNIYVGTCIDTAGKGFCAEQTAISTMITNNEHQIKKIVAVWKDENNEIFVIPPCGQCREFMKQVHENNVNETEVILDKDKTVKLYELLPYHDWWQKQ